MARLLLKEGFSSPASATSGLAGYDLEGQRRKASPRKQRQAELRETRRKLRLVRKIETPKPSVDNTVHLHAATSPYNLKPLPSVARIRAGNYAKGHIKVAGIDIAIENPAGSKRRPEWPELKSHYGYIKRTEGADGDQVDCFVKPGTPRHYIGPVFVVNQFVSGKFDEHKCMIGWYTEEAARKAYLDNYTPNWNGLRSIIRYSVKEFKVWLRHGDTTAMAKSSDKYEEFAEWFLLELGRTIHAANAKPARIRTVAKYDVAGHEFHGNQWTGGLGAKPSETKATEKSKALKELMASGHSFTVSQIAKATGASTTYVSKTLKGMAGTNHNGLTVVKEGNGYKVVEIPTMGQAHTPDVAHYEPHPATAAAKSPEASIKPVAAAEKPAVATPSKTTAEPPASGKMEKAAADKIYDAAKNELQNTLQVAATFITTTSNGDKQEFNAYQQHALLAFKQGRHEAMQQWKANTTGEAQKITGQQVYKSDEMLFAALGKGQNVQDAIIEWKNNTAQEKSGTGKFAPAAKPEASSPKPAAAAKEVTPVATTKGQELPELNAKNQISVHDFQGSKTNFETLAGRVSSAFTKESKGGNGKDNKVSVQQKLDAQLKDNAAFQKLQGNFKGTAYDGSLAARLVGNWARTSNDNDHLAIAMQLATRDEFNLDANHLDMNRGNGALKELGGESQLYASAAKSIGFKGTADEMRQGLMAFQRAQYDVTQKFLADAGIKEVAVVRGMHDTGHETKGVELGNLVLQPASSFSHQYSTAKGFSGGSNIFAVKVPASQVLGSYVTGFGCTNEKEIVVLGGKGLQAIRVGAHDANGIQDMAGVVKGHFESFGK